MEKELAGMDDMHGNVFTTSRSIVTLSIRSSPLAQYAQTLARLEHADLQVEDLKEQLDDALGAEEMLVQLTEKNLFMGEVTLWPC